MGLRAAGRDLDLWAQDPNAGSVRSGATALKQAGRTLRSRRGT